MTEVTKPQSYVGISGVAHYEQHLGLFDIAQRERISELGHFVMVGIQATGKTQVQDIENKRGQMWHPVGESITDAAANEDSGLTKPYIHCYFAGEAEMLQGVANVMRRTRHYVQGLQFNGLPWVTQNYRPLLSDFKEKYPGQSIILQAGSGTLNNYSPNEVATELETMPVDYLLLDPSGGWGKEMDVEQMRNYVDEIYQRQLPIGVAVSGGLEAKNVERLFGPLVEIYPDLSCDAEGRLRKGIAGVTTLNMDAAEQFILAWKKTLQASRPSAERKSDEL